MNVSHDDSARHSGSPVHTQTVLGPGDRRRYRRHPIVRQAHFGLSLPIHAGTSLDLSSSGLMLLGSFPLPPGSRVVISIVSPARPGIGENRVVIEGVVRWCGRADVSFGSSTHHRMGIEVTANRTTFENMVRSLAADDAPGEAEVPPPDSI